VLSKLYHLPIQSAASGPSRNFRSGGLTLKVFKTDLPFGRFGIIIPKAVCGAAVLRNRLKRAAFDAFDPHKGRLGGWDVLGIVSKGAPETKDAMMKELSQLLAQIPTNQ
jgi:ribonuclease P protein component